MLNHVNADALWISSLRAGGRSEKTILAYQYALRQLREFHGNDDLLTVTRLEAMSFFKQLGERFSAHGNVGRLKSIKAFYNWCVAEEFIDVSPFARISITAPQEAKPIPTDDEIASMFAVAKKGSNPRRDGAMLAILVCSGARKGEVAALEPADIDITAGTVRFRVSKSRARTVPLDDRAVVAVGRWLRERGTGSGSLWASEDSYQLVDNVMVRVSGGKWRSHSLRRAFAANWLRRGGSEGSLLRLAGWSSSAMIRAYVADSADLIAEEEYRRMFA